MRSNYKKLSKFITKVDKRNKDLSVSNLKGLSMTKEFRESTSNIVGTDMSKYKIVEQWKFACDFMSVIRVHAFPVVLNLHAEPVLVSPAYPVFQIDDHEELNPEYLMMWFRRSEFDRYADFKCDSAIRGGFGWDELCDIELPVPPIEKQREIVHEYNAVNDRITLNEQFTNKLEEITQVIYEQWFVDFEFPISKEYAESIGKPELEGKPYQSSGGDMKYCNYQNKNIPIHWNSKKLDQYCDVTFSKRIYQSEYVTSGVPFFRSKEIILKRSSRQISSPLYISRVRFEEITQKFGKPEIGDILITAVGTIGVTYMVRDEEFYIKDGNLFWLRNFKNKIYSGFIYCWMQSKEFKDILDEITYGSTQNVITTTDLCRQYLVEPDEAILKNYFECYSKINNKLLLNCSIKTKMHYLRQLILAKMSKE